MGPSARNRPRYHDVLSRTTVKVCHSTMVGEAVVSDQGMIMLRATRSVAPSGALWPSTDAWAFLIDIDPMVGKTLGNVSLGGGGYGMALMM